MKNASEKREFIPYGRQFIDEDDIEAVVAVLQSDWLTTGPKVGEFEEAVASFSYAENAVAVSSGTAALHCAMHAIGVGPEDEVIVPAMTFAASANCVVYQGARPVFADVTSDNLLIDPESVREKISPRTKAIIAVDYAGHPCDYDALAAIASEHNLVLVADACHSLGGEYKGRKVGSLAALTVLSFHPVKHITTGEGGMILTNNADFADKMRRFRNHGISTDHRERQEAGTWHYSMIELGYNYRLSDIQCALGMSQLAKLSSWLEIRRKRAKAYDRRIADIPGVSALAVDDEVQHAYHLYPVLFHDKASRDHCFERLREEQIGVNVHYIPVHLHPFYQEKFQTRTGMCPVAEEAYGRVLSLPMHQGLGEAQVDRICRALHESIDSSLDPAC